jgi:hypothetical protein
MTIIALSKECAGATADALRILEDVKEAVAGIGGEVLYTFPRRDAPERPFIRIGSDCVKIDLVLSFALHSDNPQSAGQAEVRE